jgi:hypothetical protein
MAARPAGTLKRESPPGAAAHDVLTLPVVVTVIENVQSVTAATSMYWSSQKSPPWGVSHFVVHPPVSVLTHDWSHEMFAWTEQDPLQQSWHTVVQSVDPGCTWQLSVHFASQCAEHSSEQPSPVQLAVHPASQSLLQCSWQLKVAGSVVHSVRHLVSQVFVQVVDADSVHIVEHVAL